MTMTDDDDDDDDDDAGRTKSADANCSEIVSFCRRPLVFRT